MSRSIIRLRGDVPPAIEQQRGDGTAHASVYHSGLTPAQLALMAENDEIVIEVYEKTSGDGYDERLAKRAVFRRASSP